MELELYPVGGFFAGNGSYRGGDNGGAGINFLRPPIPVSQATNKMPISTRLSRDITLHPASWIALEDTSVRN